MKERIKDKPSKEDIKKENNLLNKIDEPYAEMQYCSECGELLRTRIEQNKKLCTECYNLQ